ncbi:MAG: cytochrome b5 domain-containing protein [Streptomycetaceae bacterium]|jgi:hypothetical protein|nr:MAG: cytochrome b5 domain-containing protein [Streptomycetaceae bacterium]
MKRSSILVVSIFFALTSATAPLVSAAGPQTPSCGNYKVTKNEVIVGVEFPKGTYQINVFGISCTKVMGSKGLFAQFLKLKDKDPLPKPWSYLADAIGAPKFSSGPGVGFRVQLITPTPTPTPTPTVAPQYTMAKVRANNNSASCWTVINGNVYNLTLWIEAHPGGPSVIRGLCGVDGTSNFNSQHQNQSNPAQRLSGYLLGPLTN